MKIQRGRKKVKKIVFPMGIMAILLLSVMVSGCTSSNETKTFTNNYMSFDYPSNWQIKDSGQTVNVVQGETNSIKVVQFNTEEEYLQDMDEWEKFTGVVGVKTTQLKELKESVGAGNITYTTFTTKDKYYLRKYYFEKNGKYYAVNGLVSAELENLILSMK